MGETKGQFSGSKEWGKLSGAKFFKNPPQKTYLDIMSFNMYIEFFYTYIHIIFCLLSSDNLQVLMLPCLLASCIFQPPSDFFTDLLKFKDSF